MDRAMAVQDVTIRIHPVRGTAMLAGQGAAYVVRFLRLFRFLRLRRKAPRPPDLLADIMRSALLAEIQRSGVRLTVREADELVEKVMKLLEKVFSGELDVDAIPSAAELLRSGDPLSALLLPLLQDELLGSYGERVLAANGEEALRMFLMAHEMGRPFDLVCLDITVPDISGYALLKRIRSLEAARGIVGLDGVKVVMVASRDDPGSTLQGLRERCEAYLVKPVTKKKLWKVLASLGLIESESPQQGPR